MSQGSTVLPTTGVFSGLTEQSNINAALAALLSNNSGATAPSSPTQFQYWADTSVGGQVTLRWYLGTTWVPLAIGDTATGEITLVSSSPQGWVVASGTHDAIVATYDPPVTTLVDGMVLSFRATSANQTATPTFNPNGLGALTITKLGGASLWGADIPGSLAEVSLRYNAPNTRWEIISPIFSVPVGGVVPWFGAGVPVGFALPQGQNLSATTYPIAALVLGTTYGNPGGGNFTMPDLRGRGIVGLDAGGSGRITVAGGNWDGTVLGATGGSQNRTIAQNQLPNVAPSFAGSLLSLNVLVNVAGTPIANGLTSAGGSFQFSTGGGSQSGPLFVQGTPAGTISSINGGVSQQSVPTLPPTMSINVMMRIG